jgi:NIMA (never in mitosis gene a)-related kinase
MDRYRRVQKIATGSYGVVDLVQEVQTKKYVVMKTITVGGTSPVASLDAAKKEADLLRNLRHPNIIQFIDSFVKSRSEFVIVLEYADAQDLQQYINRERQLPEPTVLKIFGQVILALAYLHSPEVHVLHRDLKAANVFRFKNGLVKLGDFGISRELRGDTLAQTLIGTPYFLSPELLKNQPYGFPADIWAAGCVLYELMTGEHAFQGGTRDELFTQIKKGKTPEIPGDYSPQLKQLLAEMLDKIPSKRPTANDILAMPVLQGALDSLESEMRVADRPPARPPRRAPPASDEAIDQSEYPEWIRNNDQVRDELVRQSLRQLQVDAAALADVVRSSVSKQIRPVVVSVGTIESDLSARRNRLEADARKILGSDKFQLAYDFIKKNYCENREELAVLLGVGTLPNAIKLVDVITMIERYE